MTDKAKADKHIELLYHTLQGNLEDARNKLEETTERLKHLDNMSIRVEEKQADAVDQIDNYEDEIEATQKLIADLKADYEL